MIDRDTIIPDPKIVGLASNGYGQKLLIGVYFLREIGGDAVKIGFSRVDPRQRLLDLQRGNPRELEIFAFCPGETREAERDWHRRYASDRLVGEWFKLTDALRIDIDARSIQGDKLRNLIRHVAYGKTAIQVLHRWMSDSGVTAEEIVAAGNFSAARVSKMLAGMNPRGISLHMARVLHQMAAGAFEIDDIRPGTSKGLAENAKLRAARKLRAAKQRVALLEREAA